MFKLALLGAIGLGAAGAASAQTADTSTWSGPYVGLHAGYGFDDGRRQDITGTGTTTSTAVGIGTRPNQLNENRSGFVGGGQVGWNFQRGRWVFGPEGDFSYMHSRGTASVNTLSAAGTPQNSTINNRLDWMGSARLRAGYTVGSGLIYGTGGYAVGKVKGNAAFYAPNGTLNYAGGDSYTAQGWLAGLGAEFRPFHQGSMSRISFGLEGTYYDLGRSHIVAQPTTAALIATGGNYVVGRDTRGFNGVFKINYGF